VKRASSTVGHLCRALAVWAVLVGAGMPAAAQQSGPAIVQPPGTAAGTAVSAAEYRLGAGDVIRIAVFQNPDLTLETRVTESGLVSYPLLGNIRLGGQSVTQAEALIAEGLRSGNFVRQAQVTITVLQVRGHQASVLGQVNRPGRFPLETGDVRLTDLLAMAGGTGPNGSDVLVVTGVRDGQPFRREVDLPTLFAAGGHERNLPIRNGDVVWVDRQPQVYIYGEVQRPGPMRLERGMTLMQALATGGGLTQRGTEKGIRVHRRDPDGAVRVVTPGMDDRVQDGDVVYVRESLF
jgi:polysaccharide biosynthesis/export protein